MGGPPTADHDESGVRDELPPTPLLLGALEATEDGLLVMDGAGEPVYYNRRLTELLSLPSDLLDHHSPLEAAQRVKEQFREPDRFVEAVAENLRNPEEETEHEFRLRDGRVIQRFSRPLRVTDKVAGQVVSVREVTELRDEQRRLESAQRLADIGSWEWDVERNQVTWSDQLCRIFGLEPQAFEATYQAFLDRVHAEDREDVGETVEKALAEIGEYTLPFRIVRPDGTVRHVRAFGEVVPGPAQDPALIRGVLQDVTEQAEARRAKEQAERRYQTLFEMSPLALVVSRPTGELVAVNQRFEDLLGHRTEKITGRQVHDLEIWADPQDRADILRRLQDTIRDYQTQLRSRSGELIEVELSVDQVELAGEVFLAWAIRDVTERNEYRRELEQKALYDQLTGLPNRNLLFDRLQYAIERADRAGDPLAVLFIDLDEFKAINSSFGHTVGDRVLAEAAARLQTALREADTLGRLGGDEFLAVLPATDEDGAKKAALRLLDSIGGSRFEVPDGSMSLGASVGIAPLSEDRHSPIELIRAADAAMQRAKTSGSEAGGRFRVYESRDDAHMTRLQRRERLRRAIEEDEFVLYYQPVVDLVENRLAGAEALVRWQHPELGLVPPGDFIPLAEQAGLIQDVDRWVLRHATEQAAGWAEEGDLSDVEGTFRLATNVAAPFYQSPDFSDQVWSALEDAGLPPSALQLEITERLSVSKTGGWRRLRSGGVRLAVDDFGTGYSSLRYLRQLEADALKIDRYFIHELTSETNRTSVLVQAILSLGRQLGMDVIAEGVETTEQRNHLEDLGFRYAQGYYFARPMPASELTELLGEEGSQISS